MRAVIDLGRRAHADILESRFGLADRVVDDVALGQQRRAASASAASPCRRSPSSPIRRRSTRTSVGDADPQGPDARNLWRNHWYNDLVGHARRGARARRPAVRAHRRRQPDRRRLRRPLPDDHRPQGARRLRLPRPADRHRPVRPDPPASDLAVDRQLRPRRDRHQPDHGQPRRRHPPGGDEPGALRLAGAVVREPCRGRHPHVRHGVERQGDLRRLQRAGEGPCQRRAQPVLRVRQPPRPLRGHRAGARPRLRHRGQRASRAAPRRLRVGHRIGRARSPPATG